MGGVGGVVVALGELAGAQLLGEMSAFLERLTQLDGLIGLGSLAGAMIAPLAVLRPAAQWLRSTKVSGACSSSKVTPPSSHSRARLWP
jgi:hypothetical protein